MIKLQPCALVASDHRESACQSPPHSVLADCVPLSCRSCVCGAISLAHPSTTVAIMQLLHLLSLRRDR